MYHKYDHYVVRIARSTSHTLLIINYMTHITSTGREDLRNCLVGDVLPHFVVRVHAVKDAGWDAVVEDGKFQWLKGLGRSG